MADLKPIRFSQIEGWQDDDAQAALACFRLSARRMVEKPHTTKSIGADGKDLAAIAGRLLDSAETYAGKNAARNFFENHFVPHRVMDGDAPAPFNGLVTGYYEPEIPASRIKTSKFRYPLYKRPPDLVSIDDRTRPDGLDSYFEFARRTPDGSLTAYPDRKAIETGALDGMDLELFWLEDPVDVFFIHIQGSARLVMPDGAVHRVGFAGKSGHPFTAIGRLLLERGELGEADISMQTIRAWLRENPEAGRKLMWENRSFIFFTEVDHPKPDLGPVGAASVPLMGGRSLAVDRRLHTFGTPIWVSTEKPLAHETIPFRRLMIAQDTGSAIVGPQRGDIFIGTGREAGEIAGRIKNKASFITLLPLV